MSYTAHDAEDVRRRVLQRAVALARPVRDTTDDVDVDDDGALLRDGNDDHARLRARLVDACASTRAEYDAVEAALAVDDGSVDALRRAVGAKRLEGLRAKLDAQREALARVDADAVRSTTSAMAATASERGANGATASARKAPAKAPVLRDDCDDFFAELDDS